MKTYYLFIIFTLFLFSCSNKNTLQSDFIDIKNYTLFTEETPVQEISLKSKIFNNDFLQNPVRLGLMDTILFSLNASYGSDSLLCCFSTKSQQLIKNLYPKGNGPMELLSASNFSSSTDLKYFWIYDITRQIWFGRNIKHINSKISDISIKEEVITLNLRNDSLLGLENPIWFHENFIIQNLLKYKERFLIFNSQGKLIQTIINPNLQFKKEFDEKILADIFSTRLCVTPDHSKIILAGRYLDLIEIYNVKGELQKMIKGPNKDFNFQFDTKRSIERSVLIKSPDSKRAYLSVKATTNKIYALYSGKTKKDEENYSYSKKMYVFSIEGELLTKYTLDVPIIDFVIDDKNKKLYAISIDANIVSFNF